MKPRIIVAMGVMAIAASIVFAYTKSYSVNVTNSSGTYSEEDGAVGFTWKDVTLSAEGDRISGSLSLKVWNDKRTPITQLFITVERKVYKCVFNRVPGNSSKEGYQTVTFSFTANYPSEGATYDINLIQTMAMSEEAGRNHIEVEHGGWVAKIGELQTH
jgi:hypothetical protein